MRVVKVKAEIGATNEKLTELEFMVDTGAFYSILSPETCDEIGLNLPLRESVVTADSRSLTIELGVAHLKLNGREGGILVGKMNVPLPLLGVSALESLGFKVNPVDGTLEPILPFTGAPALGTP
ncbi:MAG: aspartyl protease family protein [Dehalococcoidia bacterium]